MAMLEVPRVIYRSLPASMRPPVRAVGRAILSAAHHKYPRVFLNSIPKAGTHLLTTFLDQLGFYLMANQPFNPDVRVDYDPGEFANCLRELKAGEYLLEHLVWHDGLEARLPESGVKTLFIYREPRAAAVSFAHYVTKMNPYHRLHRHYKSLPDIQSRILATLDGVANEHSKTGHGRAPMAELYDRFLPWREELNICSVAFEDLIGPQGGGDEAKQSAAVKRLIEHLGVPVSPARISEVAESVFNPRSTTFRKPNVEGWRRDLDDETAELLTRRLEKQIVQWGYSL